MDVIRVEEKRMQAAVSDAKSTLAKIVEGTSLAKYAEQTSSYSDSHSAKLRADSTEE